MAYVTGLEYKHKLGIVRVHDSDGGVSEHAVKDFDDPQKQGQILSAYEAAPGAPKSAEERLAELEQRLARAAALEAVLIEKTVVSESEIDAKEGGRASEAKGKR